MTIDALLQNLRTGGFVPIMVESLRQRSSDLRFVGTLPEFLDAAKSLRSNVVFLSAPAISESHFRDREQAIAFGEHDEPEEVEEIDLCSVLPRLSKFRSKIGMSGQIDLAVPLHENNLAFSVLEDWWCEFVECHSEARRLAREKRRVDALQIEAEEDAETEALREKLRSLISDKDFAKLPTQRAMREYALDRYPELDALEHYDIKQELQDLKARIQARGLGRK